jgi:hypothetical protein
MKHTKGPWSYHANGDGSYSILGEKISDKEYQWIAGFWHNGNVYTIEQLANVKLMALAPELLKALEELQKASIALADNAPAEYKNQHEDLFADLHNAHLHAVEVITKTI